MGNQLAGVSTELNISDLQEGLVQKSELGGGKGRLLKGLHCESDDGDVVVKVYIKRDQSDNTELRKAYKQLKSVEAKLQQHTQGLWRSQSRATNVCGYGKVVEADKAGFVVRQYFYQSLYERIVTRPFLPKIAKKWSSFQLLKAVHELHSQGVPHGDLKAENVMVTSYGWVYVVDVAPFKPTYLKHDNPADFSFYFDTTEQHHCYLAPERFYDPKEGTPDLDAPVTEKMDVFAAACIIAQLFMDGDVLFNLGDLLAYRKGTFDPFAVLEARIEDPDVVAMLKDMLVLDPAKRLTAKGYMEKWTPRVFPHYFEMFYSNVIGGIIFYNPDERMHILHSRFDDILNAIRSTRVEEGPCKPECNPTTQDTIHSCAPTSGPAELDVQEGVTLLSLIICGSIRHCKISESRVLGLHVIDRMADLVTDDTRLQRLLPYTVAFLADPAPLVRAKATQTTAILVSNVQSFPPSEASLFEEYIMPSLSRIPRDISEHVRATYAEVLPEIAYHARRFLETRQLINRSGHTPSVEGNTPKGGYDTDVSELQDLFQTIVQDLSGDKSILVCRALLSGMNKFCVFFGIARTNDFVLPMLTTFCNSRDAQLRRILYRQLVGVACYVGPTSLQNFILPCILQAMNDMEEQVVSEAVRGLASLCYLGMFNRESIITISKQTVPLLLHPNTWIRKAAMEFTVAASKQLSEIEVLCHLMPILKEFLKYSILTIDAATLTDCLLTPVSRHAFDRALRIATVAPRQDSRPKSSEAQFESFGDMDGEESGDTEGMTTESATTGADADSFTSELSDRSNIKEDEVKTELMRDYIQRTAASIARKKAEGHTGDGDRKTNHDLANYKNFTLTVDRLRPTHTASHAVELHLDDDHKTDPLAAAAEEESRRNYDLVTNPIQFKPSKRQASRLSLRYLYPELANPRIPASSTSAGLSDHGDTVSTGISIRLTSPVDTQMPSSFGSSSPRDDESIPSVSSECTPPQGPIPGTPGSAYSSTYQNIPSSGGYLNLLYASPSVSASSLGSPTTTSGMSTSSTNVASNSSPLLATSSFATDKSVQSTTAMNQLAMSPQGPQDSRTIQSTQSNILNSVRPSSPLLCQAKEHDGAVMDSTVHDTLPHFLTVGADGTIRLWDLRRLDRDSALVSQKIYPQNPDSTKKPVAMLSCCMQSAQANACATGNEEGAFSLFDLERGVEFYREMIGSGRAGGISCIRRVNHSDTVMCGAYNGMACAIDTRVPREVWSSYMETRHGPITSLVVGDEPGKGNGTWMVTSTLRGYITLWDLRFRIPVYTWQYPQENPTIHAMSACGSSPAIVMAANHNELSRWNLETLKCTTTYKLLPTTSSSKRPAPDLAKASPTGTPDCFAGSQINPAATNSHSIRAICGFRECNWFITAGTDRKIRFWDSQNGRNSYIISGLDVGESKPKFVETKVGNVLEIKEHPPLGYEDDHRKATKQHASSTLSRNVTAHKDCVTSLSLVCPLPNTTIPLLVSCSRDGVVKIWQNRVTQVATERR